MANRNLNVVFLMSTLVFALSASGCADQASQTSVEADSESERPNILLIVADDLGYSDLGAFGGEIETPNLDALAASGVRLTNFYTAPTCSPTRSMLLTGEDNHRAGLGAMAEALRSFKMLQGRPGYEGYLNPQLSTVAGELSSAGYRTLMTGKWHLGKQPEHQPTAYGFDRSFVLLEGGADHYGAGQNGGPALQPATYTEDGQPAEYPVGTYSSDFFAQRLIDYLSESPESDTPFFAYLAFTAPHWPLQAPKELIKKYEGYYDAGPKALRSARVRKMAEMGLVNEAALTTTLTALNDWEALSEEEREIQSRNMEIYAAMVDSLDQNVGRVLDHLRATDEYENTVVIFMSDNGAEGISAGELIGRTSNSTPKQHKAQVLATVKAGNSDLSKMGETETFITYGGEWARAATAPASEFKGETYEGGVRAPAFISGAGIKGQRIVNNPLSVRDVMPTVLDISKITGDTDADQAPVQIDGISLPAAKSWKPILDGSSNTVRTSNDALAWELHLNRGIRAGDWKAVYGKDAGADPRDPKAPSSWKLYQLSIDPSESNDVSADNTEVLERLVAAWEAYARENGVFVPGPRK